MATFSRTACVPEQATSSSTLVVPAKNLPISLLDSICDTEVVEQPLVAMPAVGVSFKAVTLLLALALAARLTSISAPATPPWDARHTELARADLGIFAVQCTAGVRVQTRELGRAG